MASDNLPHSIFPNEYGSLASREHGELWTMTEHDPFRLTAHLFNSVVVRYVKSPVGKSGQSHPTYQDANLRPCSCKHNFAALSVLGG